MFTATNTYVQQKRSPVVSARLSVQAVMSLSDPDVQLTLRAMHTFTFLFCFWNLQAKFTRWNTICNTMQTSNVSHAEKPDTKNKVI